MDDEEEIWTLENTTYENDIYHLHRLTKLALDSYPSDGNKDIKRKIQKIRQTANKLKNGATTAEDIERIITLYNSICEICNEKRNENNAESPGVNHVVGYFGGTGRLTYRNYIESVKNKSDVDVSMNVRGPPRR